MSYDWAFCFGSQVGWVWAHKAYLLHPHTAKLCAGIILGFISISSVRLSNKCENKQIANKHLIVLREFLQ